MIYQRVENIFIVRLDVGEEILSSLTELCSQEKITAGTISGIGAANYADIGLYEVAKRKYHGTILEEEMEIASLNGNISRKEGKVYLHLHAAFANKQGQIFGGHLRSARLRFTSIQFRPKSSGFSMKKPRGSILSSLTLRINERSS